MHLSVCYLPMGITTIRVEDEMLDAMARAMSRSRAWVIKQAIGRYLDYEEWLVAQVKEGLEEAASGKLFEHEAVAEEWERRRAAKVDAEGYPRSGSGQGKPSRRRLGRRERYRP